MIKYRIDIIAELKNHGYSVAKLRDDKILSDSAIRNLKHANNISMESLNKICKALQCEPGDLIEYVSDLI
jgi:putative transcriptional regulator